MTVAAFFLGLPVALIVTSVAIVHGAMHELHLIQQEAMAAAQRELDQVSA
jgi:hypothetical protein